MQFDKRLSANVLVNRSQRECKCRSCSWSHGRRWE